MQDQTTDSNLIAHGDILGFTAADKEDLTATAEARRSVDRVLEGEAFNPTIARVLSERNLNGCLDKGLAAYSSTDDNLLADVMLDKETYKGYALALLLGLANHETYFTKINRE